MAEENKEMENNTSEEQKENTTPEEETKETDNPTEDTEEQTDEKEEKTGTEEKSDSKDEKEDTNPEDVNLENPEEVSEALDKKGIDYQALTDEYLKNGKLSQKSMDNLAKAGIPAEMVEDYIKGYEARAEMERNELAESVGGKEAMENIINWAAKNLDKEEIIAINAIRNKFELKAVLRGLKADMEEKEGKTPEYQKGTGDKTAINGFRSQAEMFAAIKDPKYNKDEAYRADVQKKIAASREAGIDLGIY